MMLPLWILSAQQDKHRNIITRGSKYITSLIERQIFHGGGLDLHYITYH